MGMRWLLLLFLIVGLLTSEAVPLGAPIGSAATAQQCRKTKVAVL